MANIFDRCELILGKEKLEKLQTKKVLVFGCGGVGSYVIEALARTGISNFTIVDNDSVDITNINRQLIALEDTIGLDKVEVQKRRILSIDKEANVTCLKKFILPDNLDESLFKDVDYCIDAIDTVSAKISIIEYCYNHNIKVISSMGTGNKLDPTQFKIDRIDKTSMCPLAKVMRLELKKRGIKNIDVLYSTEAKNNSQYTTNHKPGSLAFVVGIAGMLIARYVILKLIEE